MLSRVVGCALAVLVVSGSCVAVAPAADRGPFWWEPPEAVAPSGTEIEAIACPSARLCVAAAGGNILTSTDPTGGPSSWRVDHVDGGTYDGCSLCGVPSRSVACPSRYLCLAVDRAGALVMSADPAAGGSSWRAVDLDLGAQVPLAVDCASRSLCVIVGGGREAVISTDPLGGANTWRSVTIDAQPCPSSSVGCGGPEAFPSVVDVACPTENTCIAVDVAGYVLSSDSPGIDRGPWRAAHLTSTNGTCGHVLPCAIALNAIACPSSTTCLASDVDGNAFVSRAPTDGAPAWTGRRFSGAIHTAGDVACASLSRCFVTALQEIYERRDGPRRPAWTGTSLPHELTAVACLDRVRCLAGDDHGRISVGRAGPTAAQLRARLRAGLSAARRRTPSMRLTAPVPGTVQVRWRHRGRLVATGATAFDRPGTTRIRLTPMRAGRRLLRRRGPIRLAVRATLVRPLRADVTVRRVQALR